MRASRFTLRTNEATTPGRTSGCIASHDNLLIAVRAAFAESSLPETALHKAACSVLARNAVYVFSSATSSSSELDEKSSRSCCLLSRGFLLVGPPCTFSLSCGCSCLSSDATNGWSMDCLFLANHCFLLGSSATWLDCSTSCDASCSCPAPSIRGLHASLSSLPVCLSSIGCTHNCCSGPLGMSRVVLTAHKLL